MSEQATHTPGPWEAQPDSGCDWRVASPEYGTIVLRNCYPDEQVDIYAEADARLIAAAPDMLAALKQTAKLLRPDAKEAYTINRLPELVELIFDIDAAIAKAEGNE